MKIRSEFIIFLVLIFDWEIVATEGTTNSKICPPSETILPCRCSLKGEEMQIWCSHSNLPQIMEGIKAVERSSPESIDELILENNQLPALPGRFFGTLNIVRLMLRYNSIERVSNGWLNELEKNLVEIFVVEPQLRSIPPESLNGFNSLEAITIESDELKRIPDFSGLINLKYLSVNSRSLIELPTHYLKHLPKLQNVHINGGEDLNRLEAGLFENLPSLKSIDLSRNGIVSIHLRALYRLPKLTTLKLSENRISDVVMVGRVIKNLENLQKLRLDKNVISVLPESSFVDLPLLTELYLNDNQITEIQYGSFHHVSALKVIYLHNNRIRRIHPNSFLQPSGSGIESLYLYNNEIEHVEELRSLLDALPALKFLDLTQNLLIKIPFGALHGHGTIEQLHLNDNLIREIDRDALMAMPALRELRLRNNSLSDNLAMPFWNLPGLKGLDLAQNQFRRISAVLLAGLPSLRRLDLSQNLLTTIDPTTFIHSPMLETLNISFNEIIEIHPATFRSLDRLFEIDVSQNQLQDIVPGLPKIIERLSMRGNLISALPVSASKSLNLPNLRMLDMSNNNLEYIPKFTLQSLNQLRVLSFAHNQIRAIEDSTFLGTDRLELLHLQGNQIHDIDEVSFQAMGDLMNLNLQSNNIDRLAENLFINNSQIEQLDLSRNVLKDLPALVFRNLKHLQFLDLSSNSLTAMPESLSNLIALKDIDMSFNHLMYLPSIIIDAWKNIIEVRLSNNQITELKQGTVRNLPKLQYLDLSSNEINSVEPNALTNLPDLQELVLADNKLVELKDHVFENMPNLQAAHLQHNLLRFISPESFFKSPSLVYLNISSNDFHNMENIGLRTMRSLEVLDVSSNTIRTVKTMPLKSLSWLVELKMDDNQICKIHGSPFEMMPRLRVLSIRNNRLKTMHERTFRNLRGNIAILDIDGNPILCSCEMLWLSVWLDETNSPNPGPKCQNGKLLRASRLDKSDCGDLRSSNQLPLLNDHGDLFSRQLSDDFADDCDADLPEPHNQRPLASESEYFYDQYIDYTVNDTINNDSNSNPLIVTTQNQIGPTTTTIDLNNTILNYNLYNRPRPTQSSSPFTFFGYPLPSLGFGRFLGPNARKTDDKIESSTMPNRGKVRMFKPTDSNFEKYLNQDGHQYRDVAARNHYVETSSSETHSVEDRNTFKTSFKIPQPERGGFFPIMPGHVGGFIPVNPYLNMTVTNPNTTKLGNETLNHSERVYIPMIPISTIATVKKVEDIRIPSEKNVEEENFISFVGTRTSTATPEREKIVLEQTSPHPNHGSEENQDPVKTTTTSTTTLTSQSIEDSTTIPDDDYFPPTSTSETILLIPPAEEQSKPNESWPKSSVETGLHSDEKIEETLTNIPKVRPAGGGGRSRIVKVFTPQSLLNLPTAEEYFRTTMRPNVDSEYQSNEYITYLQTDEPPKKTGMDWYYDNYKNKNRKIQIQNEIETVRPIRKNSSNTKCSSLILVVILILIQFSC